MGSDFCLRIQTFSGGAGWGRGQNQPQIVLPSACLSRLLQSRVAPHLNSV